MASTARRFLLSVLVAAAVVCAAACLYTLFAAGAPRYATPLAALSLVCVLAAAALRKRDKTDA